MNGRPSVLRGISLLGSAQAVAMACGVVTAALLGRAIGPEGYGVIGFGVALVAFFNLAVTLGTDTLGSRNIAREPAQAASILGTILSLRLVLLIVLGVVFVLISYLLDRTPVQRTVLLIQGGGILVTAMTLDFLFQGLHRLSFMAVRQIMASVLTLIGVFLLVRQPQDVVLAAMVFVSAGLVSVLAVFPAAVRQTGGFHFNFSFDAWRATLAPALPLALTGAMNTILFNTDTVMLGLMVPAHDVGLYTAAFRLLMVALVPAGIVHAVFHARLSAAYGDLESMRLTAHGFCVVLLFAGLPVTVAGMVLAAPTIRLLFGEAFTDSVPIMTILMGACSLAYIGMMSGATLLAWNGEKVHLKVNVAAAVVNVAINFALIPRFGPMGAAVASLVSQAGMMIGFWLCLRTKIDGLSLMPVLRLLVASVSAGAVGWVAVRYFPLGSLDTALDAGILVIQGAVTISLVFLALCRVLQIHWLAAVRDDRY